MPVIPTPFVPVITDNGLSAAVAADNGGIQLAITHVQLGTSRYSPTTGQTALVAPRQTFTVAGGGVVDGSPAQAKVFAYCKANTGDPYFAAEIGFWSGDPAVAGSVLVAVYSDPAADFAYVNDNAVTVAEFDIGLASFPSGSITVTVDPDQSALAYMLGQHVADANPHPQYITQASGDARYALIAAGGDTEEVRQIGTVKFVARTDSPLSWFDPNGYVVLRADFPELTTLVLNNLVPVATEADWFHNGQHACFTAGDGATTIRIPRIDPGATLVAAGTGYVNGAAVPGAGGSTIQFQGTLGVSYNADGVALRPLIKLHPITTSPANPPVNANEYGGTGINPPSVITGTYLTPAQRLPVFTGGGFYAGHVFLSMRGELFASGGNSGRRWLFGWGLSRGDRQNGLPSRIAFPRGTSIRKFAMGREFVLAVDQNNQLWTWGNNGDGNLGLGDVVTRYLPSKVTGVPATVATIMADAYFGANQNAGCITSAGAMYLWGSNVYGQIGKGSVGGNQTTPYNVAQISSQPWKGLWTDGLATYAWTDDASGNKLYATGYNLHGQLGRGTVANAGSFAAVLKEDNSQLDGVVKVITTFHQPYYKAAVAVLCSNGDLYMIGNGNRGRLGHGATTNLSKAKRILTNVKDVTASGGDDGTYLAIKNDNTLWGWGGNLRGCLGLNDRTQRTTPTQISPVDSSNNPITPFTIYGTPGSDANNFWTITQDGDVYACGENDVNGLGTGTQDGTDEITFKLVPLPEVIIAVSASANRANNSSVSTFFYGVSGNVFAAGYNADGQLGNGGNSNRAVPDYFRLPT